MHPRGSQILSFHRPSPVSVPPPGRLLFGRLVPTGQGQSPAPLRSTGPPQTPTERWSSVSAGPAGHCPDGNLELCRLAHTWATDPPLGQCWPLCGGDTVVTRILPSEITNSSLQFHYNFQSSKSITDTIPFWTDTEEFLASTLPSKSSYQSIDCMRFHFLLDRWITHNVPFSFQSCEDDEKQYLLM